MAYRGRRHKIVKRLRLQQNDEDRDIALQNLKTIELRKQNSPFPPKRPGSLKVQITTTHYGQVILQQADYTIAERRERLYNIILIRSMELYRFGVTALADTTYCSVERRGAASHGAR